MRSAAKAGKGSPAIGAQTSFYGAGLVNAFNAVS
jgi:hypothetical protein